MEKAHIVLHFATLRTQVVSGMVAGGIPLRESIQWASERSSGNNSEASAELAGSNHALTTDASRLIGTSLIRAGLIRGDGLG